jgi:hypothetical protein
MNFKIPDFVTSVVDSGFAPEDEDTRKLYREVAAFAMQGQPIVIFGPTGSGKEFLARHYYNTLIKAEFYEQYRESWPSKFSEIYTQYAAVYPEDSLKVYLSSLQAGVFMSINSAVIYPNLAESLLFGHESGSFTDATTRPGMLESIKYGVFFMDEIGELPKPIQAKLLRAVDSEIAEGCRVAGRLNYSVRDVIIISATNQPREKIRNDFYYKLGIEVNTKGIDERPKDVIKSIPYFISKAIGKRKDYAVIYNIFGIRGGNDHTKISETEEVKMFAEEQTKIITDKIISRRWPGNFRALRKAIEASVFRIESPKDLKAFSGGFNRNVHEFINRYSEDFSKSSKVVEKQLSSHSFPSMNPGLERCILEKFGSENEFSDLNTSEKKILSQFLISTYDNGFIRKDLEEYYKECKEIRHTSEAHIRNRINRMVAVKLLDKRGNGKTTRYNLSKSICEETSPENVFAVPGIKPSWVSRRQEIDDLIKILSGTDRIFIQAPQQYGKSTFIAMLCDELKSSYNFYYYPLGEAGIKRLFEDIIALLKSKKINLDPIETAPDFPANLKPFLGELFKTKDGNRPVLIIDNAHFITESDSVQTIADLAGKWQELILVLAGDKMDNAFQEMFHEFSLKPWVKQA